MCCAGQVQHTTFTGGTDMSTYTGYRCKCGCGIHTTFDGSEINPCKECGNTSMRGEEE
mgnify:CR=1 FL=1